MDALPHTDLALEQLAHECFAAYLGALPSTPFSEQAVATWLLSEGWPAETQVVRAVLGVVRSHWSDDQILHQITLTYGRPMFRDQITVGLVKKFLEQSGLDATARSARHWFLVVESRRKEDWIALASNIADAFPITQRSELPAISYAVLKARLEERGLVFSQYQLRALSLAVRDCLSAKVASKMPLEQPRRTEVMPSAQLQKYVRLLRSTLASNLSLEDVKSTLLKEKRDFSEIIVQRIFRMTRDVFKSDALDCIQNLKQRQNGRLVLDFVREHFVAAGFQRDDPAIIRSFSHLKRLPEYAKKDRGVRCAVIVSSIADREALETLSSATKLNSSDAISLVLRAMAYLAVLPNFNLKAAFKHAFEAGASDVRLWARAVSPFDLSEYREISQLRLREYVGRGVSYRIDITVRPKPDLELLKTLQEHFGKNFSVAICLALRVLLIAGNAPGINVVELLLRSAALSDREVEVSKVALLNQLRQ